MIGVCIKVRHQLHFTGSYQVPAFAAGQTMALRTGLQFLYRNHLNKRSSFENLFSNLLGNLISAVFLLAYC